MEVEEAYPDHLHDTYYWGEEEGDYLWYNKDDGWGAAILFFFREDRVERIVLNMVSD